MFTREQAKEYHWQRYRTKWPVARQMHKSKSQTGRTNYFYSEVDGLQAPPDWGWSLNVDTGEFELDMPGTHSKAFAIRRSDFPDK